MVIEIEKESDVWLKVRHALRDAGYKCYFQLNMFDKDRASLFLEEIPEPEGGELKHGLILYDGGKKFLPFCTVNEIEQVRQEEIARL